MYYAKQLAPDKYNNKYRSNKYSKYRLIYNNKYRPIYIYM